jgi:site-specific DNA-methyltransferase (adenine-specific)
MDGILYSSRSEEWGTPQDLFDTLNGEFHFQLDAAASKENAKCERYLTKEDDALRQYWYEWRGPVWLNPPYGKAINEWMSKARTTGNASVVVCLVPARTDTNWFHRYVWGYASELRFIKGRLKFEGAGTASATFPSAIIVYRPGEYTCRISTIDRQGRTLWNGQYGFKLTA